jgi:hypothetical protein
VSPFSVGCGSCLPEGFTACLLGACLPPVLLLLAVLPAQVEGSSMCLGPAMGDCDHNWSGITMP